MGLVQGDLLRPCGGRVLQQSRRGGHAAVQGAAPDRPRSGGRIPGHRRRILRRPRQGRAGSALCRPGRTHARIQHRQRAEFRHEPGTVDPPRRARPRFHSRQRAVHRSGAPGPAAQDAVPGRDRHQRGRLAALRIRPGPQHAELQHPRDLRSRRPCGPRRGTSETETVVRRHPRSDRLGAGERGRRRRDRERSAHLPDHRFRLLPAMRPDHGHRRGQAVPRETPVSKGPRVLDRHPDAAGSAQQEQAHVPAARAYVIRIGRLRPVGLPRPGGKGVPPHRLATSACAACAPGAPAGPTS